MAQAYQTHKPAVGFPCRGERVSSIVQDQELFVTIPYSTLPDIIEGFEKTKHLLPTPIPFGGVDQEPNFLPTTTSLHRRRSDAVKGTYNNLASTGEPMSNEEETITLGGGCFWCTEAVFARLKGVTSAFPGYSGGHVVNPTYEQVSTGATGHAEVVQITYDPAVITLHQILEIFFATHDPTTLNQQGADIGTQYMSVIFCHTEDQRREAEAYIKELTEKHAYKSPIVTRLEPFKAFYPAEEYHLKYYERNRNAAYSRYVIAPKVEKLEKKFGDKLKG